MHLVEGTVVETNRTPTVEGETSSTGGAGRGWCCGNVYYCCTAKSVTPRGPFALQFGFAMLRGASRAAEADARKPTS